MFNCIATLKIQYRTVLESKKKYPYYYCMLASKAIYKSAFNFCVFRSWEFCTCILLTHLKTTELKNPKQYKQTPNPQNPKPTPPPPITLFFHPLQNINTILTFQAWKKCGCWEKEFYSGKFPQLTTGNSSRIILVFSSLSFMGNCFQKK